MDNDFEKGLQELEDLLEDAWNVPLLKNKLIVDGSKISKCVGELRLRLPGEMKRAKELILNKDNMIQAAQDEARHMLERAKKNADQINENARAVSEQLLERAKAQAEVLVSQEEVLRVAQERAEGLLVQAKNDAIKLRAVTVNYVENALEESARSLKISMNALEQAKQSLSHND
jgi:cell division septum initiation protein DivIVA